MFLRSNVLIVMCGSGSMFIILCSHGPVFSWNCVLRALCSQGPMFPVPLGYRGPVFARSYVLMVLYI